jgi:hypothetical protein
MTMIIAGSFFRLKVFESCRLRKHLSLKIPEPDHGSPTPDKANWPRATWGMLHEFAENYTGATMMLCPRDAVFRT